jgi:phospholipid/cholesterol/gamma-HCH transport system substrate-binding protein
MEIRARYFLIGVFVLVAAGAAVAFVYWLSNTGGLTERTVYSIRFDGPVSGLMRGSEVHFNGIKVGEVTALGLVADSPEAVMATIAVASSTPVRSDTRVGLDFRGLTGTATVALTGGSADAAPPVAVNDAPPMLVADAGAIKDMTQSARDVLAQLDTILAENRDALRGAIADFGTFSAALARNSDRLDGLIAGLERFAGGGSETPTVNYELSAPTGFEAIAALPVGQLVVAEPTTVVAFDTQRIMVESAGGDAAAFPDTRWSDSLPLLFQARFIQSFENAGYLRVGSDTAGISGDYQLLIDLRRFRISTADGLNAEIAFSARLVDSAGTIVAARLFEMSQPAESIDEAAVAVAALDSVFGESAKALVVWSLESMISAEAAALTPEP